MKRRVLPLLLALALACSLLVFPAHAADVLGEGDYESVHWVLTSDGILTISGTGEIGGGLRYECPNWKYKVKFVVIKYGITCIGRYAFSDCSSLRYVTIPESVTSIGFYAFDNCESLVELTIPESVTSIEGGAFSGCSNLTSVLIPAGVTSVGGGVFSYCSSLEEIQVAADNVNYKSDRGVLLNKSGTELICCPEGKTGSYDIPMGVTSIDRDAFYDCSNLTSVTIPEGVTRIDDSTFTGCSSLTSVTIPEGVTSIGNSAFNGCRSLASITIPESVTSIDFNAFGGLDSLESVTIPGGVTSIGDHAFSTCRNLKNVTILKGVASIGREAFRDCESLTSVTIPDSVTTIETAAFLGCISLKSVIIPSSVTSIGSGSFYYVVLQDVYYGGTEEQWNAILIDDDNANLLNATIHYASPMPVEITAQPVDYTGALNSTAKFSIAAEGDGLTYQWQVSDDGGDTWTNSSVKNPKYSTKMTAAKDGRMVRCIVSDQYGNSVTSDAAVMKLQKELRITTQPKSYTGKEGSSAKFTVKAVGDGLTYQWQISDSGGKTWKNSSVKKAIYSTRLSAVKDGRMVRCMVTDQYGSFAISDAATMQIKKAISITTQPKDYTGKVNSTAKFTVAAEGNGLTYQWQISDDGGVTWVNSSVKAASYSTKLTAAKNGRMVRCIVSDAGGNSVTSSAVSMKIG